jgi:imidazolonepropionase-like amidohydrolase
MQLLTDRLRPGLAPSMFGALALLALLTACAASGPSPAPDPRISAFVGVTVVPMDSDRELPEHTVLVRDGKIVAVGPSAQVDVPAGARLIDGTGRWLMPGLADMHVHLWNADHLTLFLANGVTLVRNMWGAPMHLQMMEQLTSGERFGPALMTTGPLMDGEPPIWPGSTVVHTTEEALRYTDMVADQGFQAIKVYNHLEPEVYEALMEAARARDLEVYGHVPDAVGLDGVLAAGQRSVEHLTGFLEALRAASPESWSGAADDLDQAALQALAERVADSDTWNCVTLLVLTKFVSKQDARALLDAPEMRCMDARTLASWDPEQDFRLQTKTADDFARLRRDDAVRRRIVAALHEAGAPLLLGTDTPNPFVVPGFAIHEELELLVDSGLTPWEALATGTRDVARFTGSEGQFGTVAVGCRADLVLLDADPRAAIGATRQIAGVMRLGLYYPADELQRRLAELIED